MASNDLVVLTGATGFLGFKVLVLALKAGHNVRVVVRSESKFAKILETPSIKSLNPSSKQLSYVVVPDMVAAGAYDEAVKGASHVIHCASPIPSFGDEAPTPEQYEAHFVDTARKATVGILESIQKAGTAVRVIITSSCVANVPFGYLIGQGDDRVFAAEDRIPVPAGPYLYEFQAYAAGKTAALNESEQWVAEHKPSFDLIGILPGWIFGKDELATKAADFHSGSTNSALMAVVLGTQSEVPYTGNSALVDDVAQVHVSALDPKVKGNQAFIVSAEGRTGMVWEDAIAQVKEEFPQAVAAGVLKTSGKQPTLPLYFDVDKTEETFGFKLAGYKEQVRSLVSQYVEVVKV